MSSVEVERTVTLTLLLSMQRHVCTLHFLKQLKRAGAPDQRPLHFYTVSPFIRRAFSQRLSDAPPAVRTRDVLKQ